MGKPKLPNWPFHRTRLLLLMDGYGIGVYKETAEIIEGLLSHIDLLQVGRIYANLYELYDLGYIVQRAGCGSRSSTSYALTREGAEAAAIFRGWILD